MRSSLSRVSRRTSKRSVSRIRVSLLRRNTYVPRAARIPTLHPPAKPRFASLRSIRTQGNSRGRRRGVESVEALSTTIVSRFGYARPETVWRQALVYSYWLNTGMTVDMSGRSPAVCVHQPFDACDQGVRALLAGKLPHDAGARRPAIAFFVGSADRRSRGLRVPFRGVGARVAEDRGDPPDTGADGHTARGHRLCPRASERLIARQLRVDPRSLEMSQEIVVAHAAYDHQVRRREEPQAFRGRVLSPSDEDEG